jgi:class 3 adenylate cyclase
MTETRKLSAIMAIDVVGYSRLMGEDEAGTARAAREHRKAAAPIVAGLGGRVVKTMGDGVLLEFPTVVAAVECAVTIQNMMVERNVDTPEARRIVYRIGVHLGDVLIDGDDILGDGVNIAARLESICEPGGVSISRAVYDLRFSGLWTSAARRLLRRAPYRHPCHGGRSLRGRRLDFPCHGEPDARGRQWHHARHEKRSHPNPCKSERGSGRTVRMR